MPLQILDLNGGDWRLGEVPIGARPDGASWGELERVVEWLPATVPGNVRADLVRAGRLPDLFFGTQAEASQWVDNRCWWLVRDFASPPPLNRRVHLVLRGVDYVSDLFLNGRHLGRHEGMFSPQVRDITRLLQPENRLAVRIVGSKWLPGDRSGPWLRLVNYVESRAASVGGRFPQRRDTLKCQMGFGWDFAPALRTMGIWDEVFLAVGGDPCIRDVTVRERLDAAEVHLSVEVELDVATAWTAELRCTMTGETFEARPISARQRLELVAGSSRHTIELSVPQPRLWWPWDHGRPDLYRLVVEAWAGDQLQDSFSRTIGLRQVDMEGWTLFVNRRRVYARGANWVPADILPGRVSQADYRDLLSLARQANMNTLRVWGGGLREKQAFYDLCDRLGLLVWQEFPLACAVLTRFPHSPGYLRLVETEARAIVRELRNHPSLMLWCGGNEFSPSRNVAVVSALQQAVATEDPARPFLSASPANGDRHNWDVWHRFCPPASYRDDEAPFASEFGLQAPPDDSALERFIPAEELWPPGPSWTYHGAELGKLCRYAGPFLTGGKANLRAFVRASQGAQAQALQIAIEHYRRRKAHGAGGVLVWQLNEPWPAISWSLLDHYRQPKPAYETVKRLLAPVLISLDLPLKHHRAGDDLACDVWIVNDRHEALDGCEVRATLWNEAGEPVNRPNLAADAGADSAEVVGRFRWSLPPGDRWRLTCELRRGSQILAANEYDLGVYDDIQPSLGQRLRSWLTGLVVPS